MGKKRNNPQNHQTMSFEQMVSAAALAQLKPHIDAMVMNEVQNLGQNLGNYLSTRQAEAQEMIFTRVLVLESIIMEKFEITRDDLANLVADKEDSREGLAPAEAVQVGDVVRLEINMKNANDAEFAGQPRRAKLYNAGSGDTYGKQIEEAILGQKAGETRLIPVGPEGAQDRVVQIRIERVSRPVKVEEVAGAENVQN